MTPKIAAMGPGWTVTLETIGKHRVVVGDPDANGQLTMTLHLTDDERRELARVLWTTPLTPR